jgi:hypothetical protein
MLGSCGALPCPMLVASVSLAVPDEGSSDGGGVDGGGGGILQFSSLKCIFIRDPLKKYISHSPPTCRPPVLLKELYSVPVLLKECC